MTNSTWLQAFALIVANRLPLWSVKSFILLHNANARRQAENHLEACQWKETIQSTEWQRWIARKRAKMIGNGYPASTWDDTAVICFHG